MPIILTIASILFLFPIALFAIHVAELLIVGISIGIGIEIGIIFFKRIKSRLEK